MIIFTKFYANRRKIVDFFTNSQVLCLGTIFLLTVYNPNFTSFQKCSFFWNSCSLKKKILFKQGKRQAFPHERERVHILNVDCVKGLNL